TNKLSAEMLRPCQIEMHPSDSSQKATAKATPDSCLTQQSAIGRTAFKFSRGISRARSVE
ncbi:hypothetical protein QT971_23170, partial [Microcoleus sp. herbarium19]|uniref:hypothetical protein n=1 Tax=unclassified Microcoleus TaxID=2642155 RepID=UPI002FD57534